MTHEGKWLQEAGIRPRFVAVKDTRPLVDRLDIFLDIFLDILGSEVPCR